MEFHQFVDWAFMGVISGGMLFGVNFLRKLNISIEGLNGKMTMVIERMDWHQKEIGNHDQEIKSHREKITRLEIHLGPGC